MGKFNLKSWIRGFMLGLSGKSLPPSTGKTLVGYSYNGEVLQVLPERDQETYPNVFIARSHVGGYVAVTTQTPAYVYDGTSTEVIGFDVPALRSNYNSSDGTWGEWRDNGETFTNIALQDEPFVWANHDIKKNGSLWLSASDPLFAYKYVNDRSAFTAGWVAGRKIAVAQNRKRKTVPATNGYYIGVTGNTVGDYTGATTILPDGTFPETVSDGDVYVHGDYEYRYNRGYTILGSWGSISGSYVEGTWGVKVLDKTKTQYGEILTSVCGKQIGSLARTFNGCSNMKAAPEIPETVQNLNSTFAGCSALEEPPIIPNNVNYMYGTFHGCTALAAPPVIPVGVTSLSRAFYYCSAMTEAPTIPPKVTSLNKTFYGCDALTDFPDLSNAVSVTDMEEAFRNCGWITDISTLKIPASVTTMKGIFRETNVANISGFVIPEGVTDLSYAFYQTDIADISGLVLPSSVTTIGSMFTYTPIENIAGFAIPNGVTSMGNAFAHCDSLTDVTGLVIPASVTNMMSAFFNCDNLNGTIQVNAESLEYYSSAFRLTQQPITLTGTGTAANTAVLNLLAGTADNGNVTVAT